MSPSQINSHQQKERVQLSFLLPSSRYYFTGHKGLTAGSKIYVYLKVTTNHYAKLEGKILDNKMLGIKEGMVFEKIMNDIWVNIYTGQNLYGKMKWGKWKSFRGRGAGISIKRGGNTIFIFIFIFIEHIVQRAWCTYWGRWLQKHWN